MNQKQKRAAFDGALAYLGEQHRRARAVAAAAADEKVQRALDRVEKAQRELELACQELSPIIGAAPSWRRVSALRDRVHSEWHRLNAWAAKHRGRLDLDGSARDAALTEARP